MKLFFVLFLTLFVPFSCRKNYTGYEVYMTKELEENSMGVLVTRMANEDHFNFWSAPHIGRRLRIMVAPKYIEELSRKLSFLEIESELDIADVETIVQMEIDEHEELKQETEHEDVTFARYMELHEIDAYLEKTVESNPNIATLLPIGKSSEGRELNVVKLSKGCCKKSLWMDCAIRGREWLSASLCLYAIQHIMNNPDLLDLMDWYILPVANPDGYAYTWTEDRFWSKTRSRNGDSDCVGTDPTRNFEHSWTLQLNTDTCSDTYPGPKAFSEPEINAIGKFVNKLGNSEDLQVYLTVHSYAQMILYPWGHTFASAPTAEDLKKAGDIMAEAILKSGSLVYDVQHAGETLRGRRGAGDDYAYETAHVPYSYTLELPHNGLHKGFNPPPKEILPIVQQLFAGIEALATHVMSEKPKLTAARDDL